MLNAIREPYLSRPVYILYDFHFNLGLKPVPDLTVSQWADENRYLPKGGVEPGRWRTSRTPYLREIMDNLSDNSPIQRTKVMKGTQLGFTEAGINWFGYIVHHTPAPMLMLLPTLDNARRHSQKKIAPTIEVTPTLKERIKDPRSRDSENTVFSKNFPGGSLTVSGSNSGAALRHISIKYLMLDEIDEYETDIEGQGNPIELALKRTDAYGRRKKIYILSSPTIKNASNIEREFEDSDQRYYYVPCPDCGHMQILKFENIMFEFDRNKFRLTGDVTYACEKCGVLIEEHHKTQMLEKGQWIPTNPGNEYRGYHISSLYSPSGWFSWRDVVKDYLKALKASKAGDNTLLKTWTNTVLALTWDEGEEVIGEDILYSRRENYGPDIPMPAAILTAAVDVQKDRLEALVKAWGRGQESWDIEHRIIYGDPTKQKVWEDLDEFLSRVWTHESGAKLNISCTCIDSGGHHTQEVYVFVKPRQIRRIFAVKGSNQHGAPLVSRPTLNKILKVKLFSIGVDTAKDQIYSRLKLEEPGPGYMHFPMTHDEEYFRQLTAEKIINTGKKRFYKKTRARNEAIDLQVYNSAALAIINPNINRIIHRLQEISRFQEKEKTEKEGIMPTNEKKVNVNPANDSRQKTRRIISRGIEV